MTNVIELAKQAGFDTINDKVYVFAGQHNISVELELYTKLVRNAALEEAAQKCEELESQYFEVNGDGCASELRNLKEPTP